MADDAPQPAPAPAPAPPTAAAGSSRPAPDGVVQPPRRGALGRLWHEWIRPVGTVLLVVVVVRSSLFDWNDVPSGSMRPTILEGDRIVVNKLAYGINTPFNGPKIDVPIVGWSFDNPLDFGPRWLYSTPERGDIVTFWNPTPPRLPDPRTGADRDNPSSGIRMVKRVVGLPGDTVRVVDGLLEITDADGNRVPVEYGPLAPERGSALYLAEPTMAQRRGQRAANRQHPVRFLEEDLDGVKHAIQFLEPDGGWTPSGHVHRDSPDGTGASNTTIELADLPGRANDQYFMVGDNRDNSLDSRYYDTLGVAVEGRHITGKAKFIAVSFDGSWLNPAWGRWFSGFD